MRNSYPGICYRCKKLVEPRAGHFENIPPKERVLFNGRKIRWRLQHADCAIKYRGTKVGKENSILNKIQPPEAE